MVGIPKQELTFEEKHRERGEPFDQELITQEDITEHGESFNFSSERGSVAGTLVRINDMENTVWMLPTDLIDANPEQPRENFNEDDLEKLETTIQAQGQLRPITVHAYQTEKGEIRFLINDGERRCMVIKKMELSEIRAVVAWEPTAYGVLASSLSSAERQDHNPIEIARTYRRMIKLLEREGKSHPIMYVARTFKVMPSRITDYLKFLDLPRGVQEFLVRKKLPPSWAAKDLQQLVVETDGDFDERRLVAIFNEKLRAKEADVQSGQKPDPYAETRGRRPHGLTRKDVQKAVTQVLSERGPEDEARATGLAAQRDMSRVRTISKNLRDATSEVLQYPEMTLVKTLRGDTATPPHVFRDIIADAVKALMELDEVVKEALKPPPLHKMPDKPAFGVFFEERGAEIFGGHELTFQIAKLIAEVTDNQGNTITVKQIKTKLKLNPDEDILTLIEAIENDLLSLGIAVDWQSDKEKDRKGLYMTVSAFRFKWETPKK